MGVFYVLSTLELSKVQDFAAVDLFHDALGNPPVNQPNSFGVDAPSTVRELDVLAATPAQPLRLVHHGNASRSRQLERMIDVMRHLPGAYELHLFLVSVSRGYLDALRTRAASDPRIHFHDPVPLEQIVSTLHRFDVGLVLFPPTTFNLAHALPNKFFELVQARLAIATGPSEEMARLVREYDLGIVAEDFRPETMAARLRALDADAVATYKRNADRAARPLSADTTRETFLRIVADALR